MKKLLPVILLVVIVFNFILFNSAYAADPDTSNPSKADRIKGTGSPDSESTRSLINSGTSKDGDEFNHTSFGQSLIGTALQFIALVLDSLPIGIQSLLTLITVNPSTPGQDDNFVTAALDTGTAMFDSEKRFSIKKAVFNELSILNVNFFDLNDSYELGIGSNKDTINQSKIIITLKEKVAGWFYISRLLAIIISLIVLLYVGIRMSLSTIASEEARYKKMLIDWAMSMAIIFLLPYLMLFMIKIYESLEDILYTIKKAVETKSTYTVIKGGSAEEVTGVKAFEDTILDSVYKAFEFEGGMRIFLYSLFFWFITAMHIKFFLAYFKRTFTVYFLAIISPFITVTYPIDKMGDGKAQAFENWLKEFFINLFIQPIHAAIYIVFVFTAGRIAEKAPMVAMIFLLSLSEVEKIVRKVFGTPASVALKRTGLKKGKK